MNRLQRARDRRARHVRTRLTDSDRHRLTVHRTLKHIYAQVTSPDGATILAQASSLAPELRKQSALGNDCEAARRVGQLVAERAKAAKVEEVWLDRGRFRYHGRIRALAEAAREGGLKF